MVSEKLVSLLLEDKSIKEKYNQIQKVDTTSYYHGYQHILNVLKMLEKFIDLFNIDEHEANKLFIAVLFHDIGRGRIGKGHELLSAEYMRNYFKEINISEFGISDDDLDEIYEAIKIHEQKDNLNELTMFQLLINFVDKLDVTKERININNKLDPKLPSYKYDIFREIYLDVDEVNPIIKGDSLILEFECNENMSLERLYSIPFMQVVDKLHKELASRYHLNAKTIIKIREVNYINGKKRS